MQKPKFVNKYENYRAREGTIQTGESMTDTSQAEDVDIYKCIEKYGIQSLLNQTQASEFLYLDNTNANMGLAEAIRQREQMEEYFKNMPARARKVFGDSVDTFIEKYKNREFDDFLTTGALSEEQTAKINEFDLQQRNIEKEAMRAEIRKQIELENELKTEITVPKGDLNEKV